MKISCICTTKRRLHARLLPIHRGHRILTLRRSMVSDTGKERPIDSEAALTTMLYLPDGARVELLFPPPSPLPHSRSKNVVELRCHGTQKAADV